jgi:predicted RNA-binding protein with PIN domain
MHYYIDGYNLLFRILKAGDDVRKQREELTFELEKKIHLLEINATLVFDSHYQEDASTRSHYKSLEIVFTAQNETADEFILQQLKESNNPSHHTVVTSDKKLAHLCRLRLGKTETVDEFLAWIGKRYKNKQRQKRLQISKPPELKKTVETEVKPSAPTPPASQDSAENCFDYYLDTFEKEFQQMEPPIPKQVAQEPKKPKVKNRPLSKEDAQLSDWERWQKAFERERTDDEW